jgi:hypothetical protein
MRILQEATAENQEALSEEHRNEVPIRRIGAEIARTVPLESRFFHGPRRLRSCPPLSSRLEVESR